MRYIYIGNAALVDFFFRIILANYFRLSHGNIALRSTINQLIKTSPINSRKLIDTDIF